MGTPAMRIEANYTQRPDVVQNQYPVQLGELGVTDVRFPRGDVRRYGAIGNGVANDTVAFQSAAAASAGRELVIPEASSYWRVAAQIPLSAGTTVRGCGRAGQVRQVANETRLFTATNADNVSILNVAMYGKGEYSAAWADDNHLGLAVLLSGCTNAIVQGCSIENFGLAGVWLYDCADSLVALNRVVGTHLSGAPIAAGGAHQYGIVVTGSAALSRGVRVLGNDVSQTAFGIDVAAASGVVVTGNRVHDIPGQHAMYIGGSDVLVTGNRVSQFASIGIKCYFGTVGTQRNVIVKGNIVTADAADNAGILAASAGGAGVLENVVISGNVIRNTHATPATNGLTHGILISAGSRFRVFGNVIDSPSWYGIAVTADGPVSDAAIEGNTISSPGRYPVLVTAAHTALRIASNKIRGGNPAYIGIYVPGAGTETVIEDNEVAGNWAYSLWLPASPTAKVRRNTFSGYGSEPLGGTQDAAVYEDNVDGKEATQYAAAATLTEYDRVVKANTVAAFALALKAAAGRKGRRVTFLNIGANNLTVTGPGTVIAPGGRGTFYSDGASWLQIA